MMVVGSSRLSSWYFEFANDAFGEGLPTLLGFSAPSHFWLKFDDIFFTEANDFGLRRGGAN